MDNDTDEDCLAPPNSNTFGIPNEPELLVEYELYKTSMGTKQLSSECHREVYSEAFIEDPRLGTLADLSVRALAKMGNRHIAAPVRENPLKLRIHYDSLDVNLPLKDCYFVKDVRFWRRVVLARSSDKSLPFKKIDEYDWRGMGISLKYVELVEACPAEYWPEEQMSKLGQLVSKYVRSLHIKHLQSLTDSSFSHYVDSESELDITSDESDAAVISSDESDTYDEEEEAEEEEEKPIAPMKTSGSSVRISDRRTVMIEVNVHDSVSSLRFGQVEADEAQSKRREARKARNAARQQLRDLHDEKIMEHERRKQKRALLRKAPEPARVPKRKPKPRKITGVLDMDVPPEPEDNEDKIADKRNKDKLLDRLKRYDYPAKHCHHIDLSFVRYFDLLNSLTIEFLGPELERDYHKRHLNFSYDDMVHLADGIRTLQQLKIFRLRNSRMDAMKLLILSRVLRQLDSLEVVDFGYDQLQDNCNVALDMLLDRKVMLQELELEYNNLRWAAVDSIGYALKRHATNEPSGTPLRYLGLAHNPIGDNFLSSLIQNINGTNHIAELNINGVGSRPVAVVRDVCHLLRNHAPLRKLSMAAIKLNPHITKNLICSLETNHKVLTFDCRGCDMESEEEYEADVLVRRNNYEVNHNAVADSFRTDEGIQEYLRNRRHPIVNKLELAKARLAECIENRPSESNSVSSVQEEEQEEQHQEQEFDIWTALGYKTPETHIEPNRVSTPLSGQSTESKFVYNPNAFNLEQLRQHMHLPGPGNRYYYFKNQTRRQSD